MDLHLLHGRVLLVDLLLRGRCLDLLFGGVPRIHVHERLLRLQCAGGLYVSLCIYRCVRSVCSMQEMEYVAVKTFWCRMEGRIDGLTSKMLDIYLVSLNTKT
jgi:hypothetical protein